MQSWTYYDLAEKIIIMVICKAEAEASWVGSAALRGKT